MLWPTGVLQDEIEVPANKAQNYTEMDRRGSSCPTLFVWDGDHYELVADMIGAGVIGHWVAPASATSRARRSTSSSTAIPIHEKDGKLSFRLMEPMEEVVYLERSACSRSIIRLIRCVSQRILRQQSALSDIQGSGQPQCTTARRCAGRAWSRSLPDLLAHQYVGDFELAPFQRFHQTAQPRTGLGKPYKGGPLWLLMDGEIEYFTATGMYAADQAALKPSLPMSKPRRQRKVEPRHRRHGFPAGGPRTMTADLTGKLPPGTRRIRIRTNLQIYWNSILIDRTPQTQTITPDSSSAARCRPRFPRLSAAD